MAGVVEPVLGVDELSPDLSCGLLSFPRNPSPGCVDALLLKRFDPGPLVEVPKIFFDGCSADVDELASACFVEPKKPPDEG